VPRAGFPLRTLPMSGLKGRGAAIRLVGAGRAAAATVRCAAWFAAARPDIVVGVGGYASGPAVLAGIALRVPTAILEQNHYPGATNRWLAPRVDRVCVPSEAARRRLGGVGTITGNPVRAAFTRIGPPPAGPALSVLVFGGSRGAHSINVAMLEALPRLAAVATPPSIVHQTGADDEAETRDRYRAAYPADRFEVHAFLDDMPERLAAADLALCRAGATTISELAAAGRPAVLVPYPHAADDHQRHNAEDVAACGGAVVIADRELNGATVADAILRLASDRPRLAAMGEAARSLAIPDAGERIADVADSLLAGGTEGGRVP